jgi:hypothetical protein
VATADAEGRFQIEVEAAMLMRERNQSISIEKPGTSPTGAYLGDDLRAEAPGYTPTGAPLWVPVQDSELEFLLPLSATSRIEGRVTHPGGIDVQAGRDDLEYVLPPLRWVSLRLSRAETGEPVTSARISWRDASSGLVASLHRGTELPATAEGLIRVELPIGSIQLETSAPSSRVESRVQNTTVVASGPEPVIEVRM